MTTFLTPEDLYNLTGLKTKPGQVRWLQERGYRHEVSALGRPVVLWAEVERHLIGAGGTPRKSAPKLEFLKNNEVRHGAS
ncbi:DUF4224 domain-containing protein [Acidithiobacillus sp. IBUN Pt1247-S3]|uniref:DUF4224 domain-containing protein n=1 Tax=Acidithiobacillus sp. IBUN Pt1247-S3 TaxID=3166642 RepID=UPI0034E448F3